MCEIQKSKFNKGNLAMTCKTSKKPLTVTNQWGMFCEDFCNLEECKKAEKDLNKFMDGLNLDLFKLGGVAQSG